MYCRPEALSLVSASVRLCALKLCCSVTDVLPWGPVTIGMPSKTNRTPGSDGTVRIVRVIGHGCTDPPAKAGGAATAPPSDTAAITPSTRVSLIFTRPPPWSRRPG